MRLVLFLFSLREFNISFVNDDRVSAKFSPACCFSKLGFNLVSSSIGGDANTSLQWFDLSSSGMGLGTSKSVLFVRKCCHRIAEALLKSMDSFSTC